MAPCTQISLFMPILHILGSTEKAKSHNKNAGV